MRARKFSLEHLVIKDSTDCQYEMHHKVAGMLVILENKEPTSRDGGQMQIFWRKGMMESVFSVFSHRVRRCWVLTVRYRAQRADTAICASFHPFRFVFELPTIQIITNLEVCGFVTAFASTTARFFATHAG